MALFAGVGVALLGATALAGWLLHNEALKTIIPGADVPIKPNIATGMLLCGAALSLLSRKTLTNPIRICTAAMATTVITLSALTVGEFLLGWDLGIDQWLMGTFRQLWEFRIRGGCRRLQRCVLPWWELLFSRRLG